MLSLLFKPRYGSALEDTGFTLKVKKCTELGTLEDERIPFIGNKWIFDSGSVTSQNARLDSVEELQRISNEEIARLPASAYQRLIAKIVWVCLARRPMFAALSCAAHMYSTTSESVLRLEVLDIRSIRSLTYLEIANPYTKLSFIVVNSDASPWRGAAILS